MKRYLAVLVKEHRKRDGMKGQTVMKRSSVATALAVLVVSCVVVGAPTTSATSGATFAFQATNCLEGAPLIPVQAAALKEEVKPPFKIKEVAPGVALLGVTALRCETMAVNGEVVATDAVFSDVGVLIDAPDGSPDDLGAHIYELWHITNVKQVFRKMSKIGMRSALVRGASFETVHEPLTNSWIGVEGDFPWTESPYDVTVRGLTPDPEAAHGPGANTWWHTREDDDKVIRIKRAGSFVGQPGTFELNAEPGSPLAKFVGSPKMVGAAQTMHLATEGGEASLIEL